MHAKWKPESQCTRKTLNMCDIEQRDRQKYLAIRHKDRKKRDQMGGGDREKGKKHQVWNQIGWEKTIWKTLGIITWNKCIKGITCREQSGRETGLRDRRRIDTPWQNTYLSDAARKGSRQGFIFTQRHMTPRSYVTVATFNHCIVSETSQGAPAIHAALLYGTGGSILVSGGPPYFILEESKQ